MNANKLLPLNKMNPRAISPGNYQLHVISNSNFFDFFFFKVFIEETRSLIVKSEYFHP